MIKLMVVDDEANIRRGIRQYISWDAWGIELVAEAESGEEALRRAAQAQPDILLTDIRMGQMDGIELTRRLKELFPALRVILLSGYSDVQYLQSALQIKADEYLLKPAGADKIIETVLRLKEEILEERDTWQKDLRRAALLDESIPIIQMHFVDDLMKGALTDLEQLRGKARLLNIPLDGPYYAVLLVDARGSLFRDEFKSARELDMNFWQFMQCTDQIAQRFDGVFWCETGGALGIFLLNGALEGALECKAQSLAQNLISDISLPEQNRLYVGMGPVVGSPLRLSESFERAQQALLRSAWSPHRQILHAEEERLTPGMADDCRGKEGGIITSLVSGRYEKAVSALHEYFDACRAVQLDFREVKMACRRICALAARTGTEDAREDDFPMIEEFCDAAELEKWVGDFFCRRLLDRQESSAQFSELTRKALRYLETHYAEDITLQSLSKKIFVSPNYLGRVFLSDVGCKLGDWLNRYRVARAKELLCTTDQKTYEIAEAVGFSSYKYFSVCFLKYMDCSARDYRNRQSRGD